MGWLSSIAFARFPPEAHSSVGLELRMRHVSLPSSPVLQLQGTAKDLFSYGYIDVCMYVYIWICIYMYRDVCIYRSYRRVKEDSPGTKSPQLDSV